MSRTELFTVDMVAEALRQGGGIYTAAAAMLKCAPNTIRGYVERHPELRQVLEDVQQEVLDLAESQLLRQIRDGNLTATIFFLKCKGKERGYVERQEMTGPKGGPIRFAGTLEDISDLSDDELRAIVNGAPAEPTPSGSPPGAPSA